MGRALSRLQERRKAEREGRRAEERAERRREEERERAREAERQQQREQERREAAKAREREFEAAGQKARERAAAHRERVRVERRRRAREADRRDAILAAARAARREEAQQLQRAAEEDEERAAERRDAERAERAQRQRMSARTAELRAAQVAARRAEETARQRASEELRRRREERTEEARSQQRMLELQQGERERQRDERAAADRRIEAEEAARSAELDRRRLEAAERARDEERLRSQRERLKAAARSERTRAATAERRAAGASHHPHPNPGPRPSSGVISGSLGWWRAQSRWLVDEAGARVTLRGVAIRGLERPREGAAGGESARAPQPVPAIDDERASLLAAAGATAITVPIAQDLALEGREDAEAEDYLEALDGTIATAAGAGLHTIVQLSLLSSVLPTAAGNSGDVFEPALPDADSVDLWGLLARRYADEPAVLFDLFRSPHAPQAGDSLAFLLPRPTWSVWRKWLLAMLGEIRREHPRATVIAGGLERGTDLSGFPLRYSDGSVVANVLYSFELSAGVAGAPRGAAALSRRVPLGRLRWAVDAVSPRQVEEVARRMAAAGVHWVAFGWEPDPGRRRRRSGLGEAVLSALSQPRDRQVHLAVPDWAEAYRPAR